MKVSSPLILNLGCGSQVSPKMVNIDWSLRLLVAKHKPLRALASLAVSSDELEALKKLNRNIQVHNIKNGIPAKDNTVDLVYHSHVLEHIDRCDSEIFLKEIWRVLKPGGLHRICVPDLRILVEEYRRTLDNGLRDGVSLEAMAEHDGSIADMFEQCVRREAAGSQARKPLRRFIENFLAGDARGRGETHQWMYDFVNIKYLLTKCGFADIVQRQAGESQYEGWAALDMEIERETGVERKANSLYVECIKPQ